MKSVPVYDPITFVQGIADRLTAELSGPVPDTRLRIAIAKELQARPDLIIHTSIATGLFKNWHRVSNKILNKAPGLYVPALFVKVANGVTLKERDLELPHLDSWDELDEKGFLTTKTAFENRVTHRERWRLDMRRTGLTKLWEVQREVYGFDESKAPDPFAASPDAQDDDEPEA